MKKSKILPMLFFIRGFLHGVIGSIVEGFQKHCPVHIAKKLPKIPKEMCPNCGKPLSKICAFHDGEGWSFLFDCDDNCGEHAELFDKMYPGWWPFWFRVWDSGGQLEKLGIEVQ
jgi:hypothetical protein